LANNLDRPYITKVYFSPRVHDPIGAVIAMPWANSQLIARSADHRRY
jgi:hypothetical protein